jgi:nicotinamidase-related amidase
MSDATPDQIPRFFDYGLTFVEPIEFDAERVAVLVIDMQYSQAAPGRSYCLALDRIQPGSCAYYEERLESKVVPGIAHLVRESRARGVSIVYLCLGSRYRDLRDMPGRQRSWIRALEERSGVSDIFWAENPDYAIREELAPQPDDTVVHKTTFGAFNSSTIDDTLRAMGKDTLIVSGISTNACVDTTARDAADRGFATAIVDECTADFDPQAHDATLRGFHFNFGSVIATARDAMAAIDRATTL